MKKIIPFICVFMAFFTRGLSAVLKDEKVANQDQSIITVTIGDTAIDIFEKYGVHHGKQLCDLLEKDPDDRKISEICKKGFYEVYSITVNAIKMTCANVIINNHSVQESVVCLTDNDPQKRIYVINGPQDGFYYFATPTDKVYSTMRYVDLKLCLNLDNGTNPTHV